MSIRRMRTPLSIIGRMALLSGKKILVTGVLSNRSIAYGVAEAGAAKARKSRSPTRTSASRIASPTWRRARLDIALPCDVTSDSEIDRLFSRLGNIGTTSMAWCTRSHSRRARRSRRLSRRDEPRSIPPGARHFVVQLRRAGEGACPHAGKKGFAPDAHLSRRSARRAELQHHGARQGEPGGLGALPGREPRAARHPGERHLRRPDQDARRRRHRRFGKILKFVEEHAPAAQRHHRGRRQRRHFCSPTSPPPSPGRSSTSTPGSATSSRESLALLLLPD